MTPHPTIVHAAADHHRHDLLAEAAEAWRAKSPEARAKTGMFHKGIRHMIDAFAAFVSRVIDDFEPAPPPLSSNSRRARSPRTRDARLFSRANR